MVRLLPFLFPAAWVAAPHSQITVHAVAPQDQMPLHGSPNGEQAPDHVFRVAVVGGGVAGTTAAFHIWERFSTLNRPQPQITIFEGSDRLGGKTKTVYMPPSPDTFFVPGKFPVDVGADAISPSDSCLLETIDHVGLRHAVWDMAQDPVVWNGTHFLEGPVCHLAPPKPDFCGLSCLLESLRLSPPFEEIRDNFRLVRAIWDWSLPKSLAARNFHKAFGRLLSSWGYFGTSSPFTSLREEFTESTWVVMPQGAILSAEKYLQASNVSSNFSERYIKPCVRAGFGLDMTGVRGIDTVLASGLASMPKRLSCGTEHFLDRMITLSRAEVLLNSTVASVDAGSHRRYRLSVSSNHDSTNTTHDDPLQDFDLEFDIVIVAAPFPAPPRKGNMKSAHVTIFHSPSSMSPRFFTSPPNYRPDAWGTGHFPNPLLTTSDSLVGYEQSSNKTRNLGILSIRSRTVCWDTHCAPEDALSCDWCSKEYIYRIVSRRRLEEEDLVHLFENTSRTRHDGFHAGFWDYELGWLHREEWPGAFVPFDEDKHEELPGDVEVAPGLFHLVGGAKIVDTMEMACRMGRNAAKLVQWRGVELLGVPLGP